MNPILGGIRTQRTGQSEQPTRGRGRGRGRGATTSGRGGRGGIGKIGTPIRMPDVEVSTKPTRKQQEEIRSDILKREEALDQLTIVKSSISLYSYEDMLKIAVVKVQNLNTSGYGSINDERMGVVSMKDPCKFCTSIDCPGHYGIIEFAPEFSVYNPAYIRQIVSVLTCVCNDCGKLLLTEDDMIQGGFMRYRYEKRLTALEKYCAGDVVCLREHDHSKAGTVTPCSKNPTFITTDIKKKGEITYKLSQSGGKKGGDDGVRPMSIETVSAILDRISPSDSKLLGFPKGTHPRNMIMKAILVPPTIARPAEYENGNYVYDTLTIMYMHIMRKVMEVKNGTTDASEIYFLIRQLIFKVEGKKMGMRDFKSIVELIQGKSALLRGLLMGKRNNYCGRTVAGPDPSLKFGQIRLPMAWASVLTKNIRVTSYNINKLTELMDAGHITHITSHVDGLRRYYDPSKVTRLNIGDRVDRWLQNGDRIIDNRQPTLHRQSMMAYEVVLGHQLTIGLHLSYTTPKNCDFDGDENNAWDPQDFEVEAEAEILLNVKNNVMSSEQNKPSMGLVMNSILGSYLLTQPEVKDENGNVVISEPRVDDDLFDGLMFMIKDKKNFLTLYDRLIKYGVNPKSGKAVFSALLPSDFFYDHKGVVILEGVLVAGQLKKSHVGTSHRSIIQELWKKYGPERTADFFTEAPWVINKWLIERGFSVGLADVLNTYMDNGVLKDKNKEVLDIEVAKINVQLEALGGKSSDEVEEVYRQKRINNLVNITNSIGFELANKVLSGQNSLAAMTEKGAGSKGALGNIGQIMGAIGQQFFRGQRLKPTISHGKRLLPAFDLEDNDPKANAFISSSFFTGTDAVGLHFLQAGGREGLLDTALKTAETGRMQHLMIKAFEGIVIGYDGSVRNTTGTLFAPVYNAGYDIAEMIEIDDKERPQLSSFIDIKKTIHELNVKRGWMPKKVSNIVENQKKKLQTEDISNPFDYISPSEIEDTTPLPHVKNLNIDFDNPNKRIEPPIKLTKYEKSRIVGARAMQLSNNSPPLVDIGDTIDPVKIAMMEYESGVCPVYVIRKYPDGEFRKIYPTLETI